jgi:bifunctional non-homologous end joining protein LigD
MSDKDRLERYRGKRRFDSTAEPRGERVPAADERSGAPSFVVQIHDASRMHFDFRLEVDGVLKSWAVPRGPSADPGDKRLAVPTEDHPLEYRDYEGVISGGQYGAGTVIVWDQGTYRPGGTGSFSQALEGGHASFWLNGSKLHGGYALTRFREGLDGAEAWLLVKEKDSRARSGQRAPDPRRARSARSGRTLHQVSQDGPADNGGSGKRR